MACYISTNIDHQASMWLLLIKLHLIKAYNTIQTSAISVSLTVPQHGGPSAWLHWRPTMG